MKTDISIFSTGEDRFFAIKLTNALKKRGLDVWINLENLANGITLDSTINQTLYNCKVFVPIISNSWLDIIWVNKEVKTIARYSTESKYPFVTPVHIDKTKVDIYNNIIGFDFCNPSDFENNADFLALEIARLLKQRTVFISYSANDKDEVRKIVNDIRKHASDLSIWFDEETMLPGSIIRREIEEGIAKADYLLAIFSHSSINKLNGWIGFELDQAYEKERQRNLVGHYFVIPLIIEYDVKIPGWLGTKVHVNLKAEYTNGIKRIIKALSQPIP